MTRKLPEEERLRRHRESSKRYYYANKDKRRMMVREYYLKNKIKASLCNKNAGLKRDYGITLEEYGQLLKNQGYKCAICGSTENEGKNLAVDHCHDTNTIRGLLCNKCNRGIGLLRDSQEILLSAVEYLRNYSIQNQDNML